MIGRGAIRGCASVGRSPSIEARSEVNLPKWYKNPMSLSDLLKTLKAMPTNSGQSDSITTFGSLSADAYKWIGGVLAPNGCIYGIPFNSTTILKIDTSNNNITTFGSLSAITYKWAGGVLAPNGCIYGIPINSTTILKILSNYIVKNDIVLSRLFNKL